MLPVAAEDDGWLGGAGRGRKARHAPLDSELGRGAGIDVTPLSRAGGGAAISTALRGASDVEAEVPERLKLCSTEEPPPVPPPSPALPARRVRNSQRMKIWTSRESRVAPVFQA